MQIVLFLALSFSPELSSFKRWAEVKFRVNPPEAAVLSVAHTYRILPRPGLGFPRPRQPLGGNADMIHDTF